MKTTRNTLTLCAFAGIFAFSSAASAVTMAVSPTTKDVAIGVNEVYVPGGFDSNTEAYVIASGLLPNGCYKWKTADVKHIDAMNHEVQPMATVSQGMCIMVLMPYSKEIRLGKLAQGKHKLKFMNGDGTYLEKDLSVE